MLEPIRNLCLAFFVVHAPAALAQKAHGVAINAAIDPEMARALTNAGDKVIAAWRAKAGAEGADILDAFAKASP